MGNSHSQGLSAAAPLHISTIKPLATRGRASASASATPAHRDRWRRQFVDGQHAAPRQENAAALIRSSCERRTSSRPRSSRFLARRRASHLKDKPLKPSV